MQKMLNILRASTIEDLEDIKFLQSQNHKSILSADEKSTQGFLTAQYSIDFLKIMHEAEPAVIARDEEGNLAGYVLASPKSVRGIHSLLDELFTTADNLTFNGKKLEEVNYVLVGQLCVAKPFRGMGLVPRMYDFFKKELSSKYDCSITDVDMNNPRSLKAHLNSGYSILATLEYGAITWNVVIQNWGLAE